MSALANRVLPLDSIILVTGVTGLVGSNVADQCLAYGYKVRGADRNMTKDWWLQEHFDAKYGKGRFELIEIKDFEGPYEDAVKGVSGVALVAYIPSNGDPNEAITGYTNGILNALRAAANEPTVKRFVLTSSSAATPILDTESEGSIAYDGWNDEAVKQAWTPPFTPEKTWMVYGASKVQGEQTVFKFVKEQKPQFQASTIVTPFVLGNIASPEHQGYHSSVGMAVATYHGAAGVEQIMALKAFYFVNSQDVGRFHLLGLIHPDIKNERVYPWAEQINVNDILAAFRKLFPHKEFSQDVPGLRKSKWTIEGRAKAEKLLRDLGRPGFVSFDESMRQTAEGLDGN
ncbi:NAD dependent epimerase/dehydratase [Paraphoma chrysanthemicola]|uniref:NAD dependent epimerase/dehydratase n=1 Tax=Paraphoma chrysanthemicola TaxID=798071 RepID=A0A8K0VWU4_9PLEO|nr:NAD dependent epimerase/dehydratase [Paraphoma chrysanthemicola]